MSPDDIKLTWEDFNANLNSECPPFSEIDDICRVYKEKSIDVRPYMEVNPHKVNEKDNIKVVHELFRHVDVRTLPVLRESDKTIVGVITRQDLFQYLSI